MSGHYCIIGPARRRGPGKERSKKNNRPFGREPSREGRVFAQAGGWVGCARDGMSSSGSGRQAGTGRSIFQTTRKRPKFVPERRVLALERSAEWLANGCRPNHTHSNTSGRGGFCEVPVRAYKNCTHIPGSVTLARKGRRGLERGDTNRRQPRTSGRWLDIVPRRCGQHGWR